MVRSKLVLYIFIIVITLLVFGCTSNDQEELKEYAKVFLNEYRDIIEFSNLTDKGEIIFYNNYPYNIHIRESSIHGTAIEFLASNNKSISSNYDKIDINKYNIKLEDSYWPKGAEIYPLGNMLFFGNAGTIIIDSNLGLENMNFINYPTGRIIIPTNAFIYAYKGFIQKNEGGIFINGTLALQDSHNLLIFKGQKANWSKEQAKIDANIISFYSIRNNFLAKARMTNSKAIESLEKKAKEIDIKLGNGFYYDNQGNFDRQLFETDEKDYYRIAQEGNVQREEAKRFLEIIERSEIPKDFITIFLDNIFVKSVTVVSFLYAILEILIKSLIFIKYRKIEYIKKNINIYKDLRLLFGKEKKLRLFYSKY